MIRPKLEQTVLGPVDLSEQPALSYLFLIDTAAGGRQAFMVDRTYETETTMQGYRSGVLVISVPIAASWTVLHRDLVKFRTVEESIRKQYLDGKAEFELIQTFQGSPGSPALPPSPVPTQAYDDSGLYR